MRRFDDIDQSLNELREHLYVKYMVHIGGGWYISITAGFWCVDIRKFYVRYDEIRERPTKTGLALRLREWDELKNIIEFIHKSHPQLAVAKPCYEGDDHANQLSALSCNECYPFYSVTS